MVFQPNEPPQGGVEAVNQEMGHANNQKGFPAKRQQKEARRVNEHMDEAGPRTFGLVHCHPIGLKNKVAK